MFFVENINTIWLFGAKTSGMSLGIKIQNSPQKLYSDKCKCHIEPIGRTIVEKNINTPFVLNLKSE